jgi:hypothetical protein
MTRNQILVAVGVVALIGMGFVGYNIYKKRKDPSTENI